MATSRLNWKWRAGSLSWAHGRRENLRVETSGDAAPGLDGKRLRRDPVNQVSRPVNLSACSNQVLPSGTAVTLMLCLPLKIPGRPVRPTQLKSQLGLQRRELRSKNVSACLRAASSAGQSTPDTRLPLEFCDERVPSGNLGQSMTMDHTTEGDASMTMPCPMVSRVLLGRQNASSVSKQRLNSTSRLATWTR